MPSDMNANVAPICTCSRLLWAVTPNGEGRAAVGDRKALGKSSGSLHRLAALCDGLLSVGDTRAFLDI